MYRTKSEVVEEMLNSRGLRQAEGEVKDRAAMGGG